MAARGVPLVRGAGVWPAGFTRNFFPVTPFSLRITPSHTEKYSLDYHIDFKENADMLDSNYQWKNIETRLKQMTAHPHNLFTNTPGFKQEQEGKQVKNHNRGRGFE